MLRPRRLRSRRSIGEMGGIVLESAKVEPRQTLASGFRYRFESIDRAFADLLTPLQGSTREKVSEQWVPHPPEEIWPYFCDERNLEELTPEFLNFEVLGKSTREIGEGTLIDYRLRLNGIPMGWQSRIENWEPARRFRRHAGQGTVLVLAARARVHSAGERDADARRRPLPAAARMAGVGGRRLEGRIAGRPDLLLPRDEDRRAIRESTGNGQSGARLLHAPGSRENRRGTHVHPSHPRVSRR